MLKLENNPIGSNEEARSSAVEGAASRAGVNEAPAAAAPVEPGNPAPAGTAAAAGAGDATNGGAVGSAPVPLSERAASALQGTLRSIERHPVRAAGIAVAAGALVEVELAVGLVLGAGAALMLATRSGPEARRALACRVSLLAQHAKTRLAHLRGPTNSPAPRERPEQP